MVPGSHLAEDPRAFTAADTVPAEMPRGSVVLYTGRTVHGGGANTSDQWRTGVNVDYVLGWLRQEENQYLSVPIDVVRQLPKRVQQLMGYEMGAYALGYVDDVRDPMRLLDFAHRVRRHAPSSFSAGRLAARHPVLPIGIVHRHPSRSARRLSGSPCNASAPSGAYWTM